MATKGKTGKAKSEKRVTRYTYDDVKEPRVPETGHTALLPADEQVVQLLMDNGWSKGLKVGKLPEGDSRPVVVDMDPAADPVLFWAGKRNRREVPVLPLQRNEIVSESRIAQIIERVREAVVAKSPQQGALFADLEKSLRESDKGKRVEFYTHDEGWKNKLICGDSLHVMESLLHYENLRGKVQVIYVDPPYGVKYNSNFQQRVDSTKNDEKDHADDVITIKAFRDTWALGIHSYLSYLQERLYLARELLSESGSIFVQINDTNCHLVRIALEEVFGANNFVSQIAFAKTGVADSEGMPTTHDYLLWYAKEKSAMKYRKLWRPRVERTEGGTFTWAQLPDGQCRRMNSAELDGEVTLPKGSKRFRAADVSSQGESVKGSEPVKFEGRTYRCSPGRHWKRETVEALIRANRIVAQGETLAYKRFEDDFPWMPYTHVWDDTILGTFSQKFYVVQTNTKVLERCIAMTSEPGDIVFDPTCGSGTTAVSAERLGRRWITCDTSRVATNVARERMLSSIFPHFRTPNGLVSRGFQYEVATRVTVGSIASGQEPEKVELVDQPVPDTDAIRICGPFEVMLIGRYSVEDWKGYVTRQSEAPYEAAKLENYIEVICRLYRKDAAIQGASGFVHAVAESEKEKIAISVGPLSGRVTAKQVHDAYEDALASGIREVHVLGWAFEANVGEVKSKLESRGKAKIELIMIRPDSLSEGLKVTQPEMLFSPLALPDILLTPLKKGRSTGDMTVTLKGVALFDRKRRSTDYKHADSGYISAWYLDEDYDGDCFVDCQMFFDFKKAPNLKAALRAEIDPEEYKLQTESRPFPPRKYKRIAVKVVDVYGNESTVVKELSA